MDHAHDHFDSRLGFVTLGEVQYRSLPRNAFSVVEEAQYFIRCERLCCGSWQSRIASGFSPSCSARLDRYFWNRLWQPEKVRKKQQLVFIGKRPLRKKKFERPYNTDALSALSAMDRESQVDEKNVHLTSGSKPGWILLR